MNEKPTCRGCLTVDEWVAVIRFADLAHILATFHHVTDDLPGDTTP